MSVSSQSTNLKSALENAKIVQEKLNKELLKDRIAGPFDSPPFSNFVCSPIGAVPKKQSGKFRLIHHLSYPHGQSVNDTIPREFSSVSYASLDDAIQLIKATWKGAFLAKTDIEAAFRIVPIHHLVGFKWDGKYYFEKCLPMGASSSCKILEALSTALEWVAVNTLGIDKIFWW